ncbi:protein kinase domain-containing protein [Mycolicibacterium holsaticum]|uniref:protein kinase domain-containing protein n=1 Tax=Mycolicibacterium holsaticum TaxID=152142 RepID=UPI0009FBCBE5
MPLRIGETFAGYRVLRLLGSGGMGEVYLVQHPRLPRQEALKVLRSDLSSDESFRERFIREADLASGLRHPHIVGVHDRGEYEDHLWTAMDYIDGTDVAQLLAQKYPAGMPIDLAVRIVSAVASALDYAHRKSLLHRDVKPANIIVADLDNDEPDVFLADFGIARPLEDTSGITTTNMTVGTVAYAAPEQLMGEQMDGRADQYALAATSYHLLTGAQPFPHSNPAVVISKQLSTNPPKVGDRRPDCTGLDEVVQISLAKNASDRFPSCTAFAQALATGSTRTRPVSANATTEEAPQSRRPDPPSTSGPSEEPPATGHRRPWALLGSIVAIMLVIGAVGLVWRFWGDSQQNASDGPTSTTIASPAPTSTAGAPPPSAPPTAPTAVPAPTVTRQAPRPTGDQAGFLAQARTLPSYVLVTNSSDCPNAPTAAACATDENVLALGNRACKAMDSYPRDSVSATSLVYPNYPSSSSFDQSLLMIYAANYLCPEHADMWANY